jgi:hypothetical protein
MDVSKMFKTLNADDDDWIKSMTNRVGAVVMPILDSETKALLKPSYLSHHKFTFPAKYCKDEDTTYKVCLAYLEHIININPEMFEGDVSCYKSGGLHFNNQYRTSVRLWGSEKVGKQIVFVVSVAGYKDAIAESINSI